MKRVKKRMKKIMIAEKLKVILACEVYCSLYHLKKSQFFFCGLMVFILKYFLFDDTFCFVLIHGYLMRSNLRIIY